MGLRYHGLPRPAKTTTGSTAAAAATAVTLFLVGAPLFLTTIHTAESKHWTLLSSSPSSFAISSCQQTLSKSSSSSSSISSSVNTTSTTMTNISGATDTELSSPLHVLRPLSSSSLEAVGRMLRLIQTVVKIVSDYEIAKLERSTIILPLIRPRNNNNKEEPQQQVAVTAQIMIHDLEEELERNEKALEEAQKRYARDDNQEFDESPKERQERKQREKEQMQQAAQELADTERRLTSMEGQQSTKSVLHRKSAERLLQLCRDNGGVYIKVGQHLANLDYLIPTEYIQVLSSLFNDAPQSSFQNVTTVIEEDLGAPIDALFDHFDPVPIASASLAQVHVAYDKQTKEKLAVKVQHRGLRETSVGDIQAVCSVVRIIDWLFPEFTFGWIADEMAPQLPKELDFTLEGKNAERAEANLKGSGLACCIPKIIWTHTSSRVLTMTFEEGFKVTDTEAIASSGLNKRDVSTLVSSVFNSQVFVSGFVHVDPHPANVLIRRKRNTKQPEMVLVDHGLYKKLDDDFRIDYAKLWKALMLADVSAIQQSCAALGVTKMYPLFAAVLTARPYDEIMERSKTGSFRSQRQPGIKKNQRKRHQDNHVKDDTETDADKAVIRGYAKQFLKDILVLLGVLPRQMLLLLKMNDCLRHIDMALDSPPHHTLVIAGKYASKVVYDQEWKKNDSSIAFHRKLQAWIEYMHVLWRIQLYRWGTWWKSVLL